MWFLSRSPHLLAHRWCNHLIHLTRHGIMTEIDLQRFLGCYVNGHNSGVTKKRTIFKMMCNCYHNLGHCLVTRSTCLNVESFLDFRGDKFHNGVIFRHTAGATQSRSVLITCSRPRGFISYRSTPRNCPRLCWTLGDDDESSWISVPLSVSLLHLFGNVEETYLSTSSVQSWNSLTLPI